MAPENGRLGAETALGWGGGGNTWCSCGCFVENRDSAAYTACAKSSQRREGKPGGRIPGAKLGARLDCPAVHRAPWETL